VTLEPGDDCVVLSVSDAGPGIPPTSVSVPSVSTGDTTGKPGLGLGLPIVRGWRRLRGPRVGGGRTGGGAVFGRLPLRTARLETV
jgi:signal transduction histidine kinase